MTEVAELTGYSRRWVAQMMKRLQEQNVIRRDILTFSDVKYMSNKIWEGMTIDEINSLVSLCPILATSLGLSISEVNDNVQLSTTEKIFSHLEGQYHIEERPRPKWV